jgi:hypothetical protein
MVSRKLFQFSLAPEPADALLTETPSTEDDPAELSHQLRSGRPSLGSLLVGAGHVTEEQVKDALAEGIRTGERLGEVLVRRRVVTDEVIAELLASQWQVPFVKTAALSVDPTAIRQFPHRVARELDAVPIGFERDGVVLVAIAEPSEDTFRRLSERLPDSSCVVIARSALDSLLESRLYAAAPDESELSLQPEAVPVPVSVEPSPAEPFGWAPVADVESSVPLLDAVEERDEADAAPLNEEAEAAPVDYDFAPSTPVDEEPEAAQVDQDFGPSTPVDEELEAAQVDQDFEPSTSVTEEFDPESFDPESFDPEAFEPESFESELLEPELVDPEPLDLGPLDSEPVDSELDSEPDHEPIDTEPRFEPAVEPAPVLPTEEELPTDLDAAMGAITATSTELENIRSQVVSLGRALELARRQLAEKDARLAESEARLEVAERAASEEREAGEQLRAELVNNSSVVAAVRQQLTGLSDRLDSIAPAEAEPAEQVGAARSLYT